MKKQLLAIALAVAASASYANNSTVSVDQIGSGGYQASYYLNSAVTTPEVHVLGIYESDGNHSGNNYPLGIATVNVEGSADRPVDLVLSSYTPTKWVLQGSGVQYVHSVLVNGYHESSATGIDASLITNKSGADNWLGAYAYKWPSTDGGSDTQALVKAVENIYGTSIASFSGAYNANQFTVRLAPVPEPATLMLTALGLGGVIAAAKRKKPVIG